MGTKHRNSNIEACSSIQHEQHEAGLINHHWHYNLRRSKIAILCVVAMALFTDTFVYGVIVPIIPLVVRDRMGGDSKDVGFLFGIYAFGLIASTPIFAILSDKYRNRKIPMLIGLVSLAISTVGFMTADTYYGLIFAKVAQGCAGGASWTTGYGMLADVFPVEKLGIVMGTASAANTLGYLISPPLGGLLYQHYGYAAPFQLCIVIVLIDFLCVLWISEPVKLQTHKGKNTSEVIAEVVEHQVDADLKPLSEQTPLIRHKQLSCQPSIPDTKITMITLLKNSRILKQLLAITLTATVFSAIEPTLPIYLSETFNADATTIGLVFMAVILPAFLSPLIGWAADKFGRKLLGCIGLIILVSSIPVIALPRNIYVEILPLMAFGFGNSLSSTPVAPELGSIVHDMGGGAYAQVYALLNVGYATGMFVGPVISGIFYDKVGFFYAMAIIGGSVALMIPIVVEWKEVREFFKRTMD